MGKEGHSCLPVRGRGSKSSWYIMAWKLSVHLPFHALSLFTHNTPWTRTLVCVFSDPIFALAGADLRREPSANLGTGQRSGGWRTAPSVPVLVKHAVGRRPRVDASQHECAPNLVPGCLRAVMRVTLGLRVLGHELDVMRTTVLSTLSVIYSSL